jgi:hypothetical protein
MATPSCKQPAFRRGEKVRRPCVECCAFLLRPIVPLIDSDYASPTSTQMIQHRLGDFEAHPKALQPCCKRPAQVVQPPAGNTGCGVGAGLAFDQPLKGVPRSPEKTRAWTDAYLADVSTAALHAMSPLCTQTPQRQS